VVESAGLSRAEPDHFQWDPVNNQRATGKMMETAGGGGNFRFSIDMDS